MAVKRTQNRVAQSRVTLQVVAVYALAVWVAGGLLSRQLWPQLACFLLSTYLMMELNNSNALIRVYSHTVSSSFAVLTCAANFLFSSLAGGFFTLCLIGAYSLLLPTYQDKQSAALTFYAFACISLASLAFVKVLWLVPLLWLYLYFASLSWRTFAASLLGLLTPYWLLLPVVVSGYGLDEAAAHFGALVSLQPPAGYSPLSPCRLLTIVFTVLLALTGVVHFWRNSTADRIRIRQFYSFFTLMAAVATALLVVLPQYHDTLLRLLIINTAPLAAHFLTLTSTRVTNIAFYVICAAALLLTALNLWMPSLAF